MGRAGFGKNIYLIINIYSESSLPIIDSNASYGDNAVISI